MGLRVSDNVSESLTSARQCSCLSQTHGEKSVQDQQERLALKQEKRGVYAPSGWAVL